ncbi:MAG: lysophospholipid acyltransferase family protein [Candidatus Omnitrophica bacterium]|nr:lysophospholipid acyltransferase family protein [Candidatus Omnitrophota bacterium]
MDPKNISKNTQRYLAWLGLKFCSFMVKLLPGSMIYGFARSVAWLAYKFVGKQRKIAFDSLTMAFEQEKPAAELRQIAKDCFVNIAKGAVELMFLMERPRALKAQVDFVNKENLEKALAAGKGVILVSAHFGNFPLMMAKLSLEGYKTAGIMRQMRDERAEKFFLEKRNNMGIQTIYSQPRKTCVEESIRALRTNSILFIPIDQNFGTAGVFVKFFGVQAATATGPVVLAQRTQASILPCFIVRQPDDRHKIFFEPPLILLEGKDERDTILINIQCLTDIIEAYIRKYPAEWGWVHRRWKSKPASTRT